MRKKIIEIKRENLVKKKAVISYLQISILICATFAIAFLLAMPEENIAQAQSTSTTSTSEVNYCCEKTKYGAFCQNAPESDCDISNNLKKTPTSCEATSFCKLGCCYDSAEGTCARNTPQTVCQNKGGTWDGNSALCDIAQCNMGCCVLGTQANFVTLAKCKKLSSFYNLETDFRTDITNELECINVANALDEGACVYQLDYTTTCQYGTKQQCDSIRKGSSSSSSTDTTNAGINLGTSSSSDTTTSSDGSYTYGTLGSETSATTGQATTDTSVDSNDISTGTITGNVTFYPGYLCSAEELGTNCGPTESTTCVEGKDEVYFKDSCGNIANIYDSSKVDDNTYWKKKIKKEDSCGAGNIKGNSGDKTCGNCDYFYGSICRQTTRSDAQATYGDYICKNLDCKASITSDGKSHKHGESWCSTDKNVDGVGSRYFRHVCVDGEEIVEPCADYRQEVCIEETVTTAQGDFNEAACRVNRWQTCTSIYDPADCENTDQVDCKWVEDKWCPKDSNKMQEVITKASSITGTALSEGSGIQGLACCVPTNSPGLQFWDTSATDSCSIADTICIVSYEKSLFGDPECVKNCECLQESGDWASKQKQKCKQLGDCDGKVNFVGQSGYGPGYEFQVMDMETAKSAYATLKGTSSSTSSSSSSTSSGTTSSDLASTAKEVTTATQSATSTTSQLTSAAKSVGTTITGKAVAATGDAVLTGDTLMGIDSAAEFFKGVTTSGTTSSPASSSTGPLSEAFTKGITNPSGSTSAAAVDTSKLSLNTLGSTGADKLATTGASKLVSTPGFTANIGGKNVVGTLVHDPTGATPDKLLSTTDSSKVLGTYDTKAASWGSGTGTGGATPAIGIMGDSLVQGALWGGGLALVGGLLGSLLGPDNSNAGTAGAVAGLAAGMSMSFTHSLLTTGFQSALTQSTLINGAGMAAGQAWLISGLVGAGVGFAVFALMYKEKSQKVVLFRCQPFEAPRGGTNCEKCNSELYPCTEYRCKSLGQTCELLNKGTGEEKCFAKNREVRSPAINAWVDVLTKGYKYTEVTNIPSGATTPGKMRIVNTAADSKSGCVKAFTPITFGITNDEPAQCAISLNSSNKKRDISQMDFLMDSGLYLYNHSIVLNLPSPSAVNDEAPTIKPNNEYSWFIKCKDGSGNQNEGEFNVKFCVEEGPDTTPPEIFGTSVSNGNCFQFNLSKMDMEVYVNKPSECKWDKLDRDYEVMDNNMTCATSVTQMNNLGIYKCFTTLTGLKDRVENKFYIRCKSYPYAKEADRFPNRESYVLNLKGSQPLTITSVKPNNSAIIQDAREVIPVDFEIETDNGCSTDGKADCYYSQTGNERDYVMFASDAANSMGNYFHNQTLSLPANYIYTYYFKCVDNGGNIDKANSTFALIADRTAPSLVRVFNENEKLKIFTNEKSTCVFSNDQELGCTYNFENGIQMDFVNSTEHSTDWNTDDFYYIKCTDTKGNQPSGNACSFIAKPSKID